MAVPGGVSPSIDGEARIGDSPRSNIRVGVTAGNPRFSMKVDAMKKGVDQRKIREPAHAFGKSTTSAQQFLTSAVMQRGDNLSSP
jgi:hypothetical protein